MGPLPQLAMTMLIKITKTYILLENFFFLLF